MTDIKSSYNAVVKFLQEGLWVKDTSALPAMRRMFFTLCRISMLVVRGYTVDKCSLQASALTYISLISLVPILAIMFSVTKGLGINDEILHKIDIERVAAATSTAERPQWTYRIIAEEEAAMSAVSNDSEAIPITDIRVPKSTFSARDLPEPMQQAIINIFTYVENTNFATLGIIGSIALFFGVIGALSKLEGTMNTVWGVKQGRSYFRKCSDYVILLLLMTIILMLATSLNTFILSNKFILQLYARYSTVAKTINFSLRAIITILILLAFAMFYTFMPNTRVKALPALVGGSVTGILWFGVQWAYLHLQVGLTRFNTIYGSFAVVPFFLAWLYANWSIVLFGAEFTFAIQNHKTIHIEKDSEKATSGMLILLAQILVFEACRSFRDGKGPWSPIEFGHEHGIPIIIIRRVLHVLIEAKILIQVGDDKSKDENYVPGKDIFRLTPGDVEEAFRQTQTVDFRVYVKNLPESLREHYTKNIEAFRNGLSATTFGTLVQEEHA